MALLAGMKPTPAVCHLIVDFPYVVSRLIRQHMAYQRIAIRQAQPPYRKLYIRLQPVIDYHGTDTVSAETAVRDQPPSGQRLF